MNTSRISKALLSIILCSSGFFIDAAPAQAGIFSSPANYWECILEEMPGVQNDPSARAVSTTCYTKFPDTSEPVGVSSPLIGAQTRNECFAENSKSATSHRAIKQIRMACHYLFPEVADQSAGKYLQRFDEIVN